jgi:molybdopterin molybdotransferase
MMHEKLPLGLAEALQMTLGHIEPLRVEDVMLLDGLSRALATDIDAKVDSPSIDASLKDGYAVVSRQVQSASSQHPVSLKLVGSMAAGATVDVKVLPGTTVRVLTGAKIPPGADAVVAEEFVTATEKIVTFFRGAEPGRTRIDRSGSCRWAQPPAGGTQSCGGYHRHRR